MKLESYWTTCTVDGWTLNYDIKAYSHLHAVKQCSLKLCMFWETKKGSRFIISTQLEQVVKTYSVMVSAAPELEISIVEGFPEHNKT